MPEDINNVSENKKDVQALESETSDDELGRVNAESVKENGNPNFHGFENAANKPNRNIGLNNISRNEKNIDGEKTFSILIRGRRNRKQTLRMPISLLTRPNSSQSFKVLYITVWSEEVMYPSPSACLLEGIVQLLLNPHFFCCY